MSLKAEDLVLNGTSQDRIQKLGLQDTCDITPPMVGIDMASANALIKEALSKFKNFEEASSCPDDSKLLANPKGIIKSFLNQAEATDPVKFNAYRKLCVAHIKEFHNCQKGTSPTCLVCSEVFQHWNTLQRHLQTHVDFRPFSCEICNRTFYSQSKLKRHAVIHNDIKPYKCPMCDRRLGRTEHLKRHLLVHSDNKPYGCSGCAHTTKRLDGIRRHIKRKHGSEAEIISLNSKKPESQIFEQFSEFVDGGEKEEENVNKLESNRQNKSSNLSSDTNLKENVSNGCKESLRSLSEDFIQKSESLASSLRDSEDAGNMECRHTKAKDPLENHYGTSQIVRESDAEIIIDRKSANRAHKDKKFPDWEHRTLMLSSQLFQRSLSGTHANKSSQHQSQGINLNQETFNKPIAFHTQAQVNSLYTNSTTFPQSDSNDSFGMPTSAILSPSFSTINRHSQASMPSVSSLSPEMMISQYFQSHQRFGSHVWSFANSPYPNY